VWQYSQNNLNAIVRQTADLNVSGNSGISRDFSGVFDDAAGDSAGAEAMTVPQPVVAAVTSAASYDATAFSPGEIVAIFGKGLGPAAGSDPAARFQRPAHHVAGRHAGIRQRQSAPLVYAAAGRSTPSSPMKWRRPRQRTW
jgi:hypothetical protein